MSSCGSFAGWSIVEPSTWRAGRRSSHRGVRAGIPRGTAGSSQRPRFTDGVDGAELAEQSDGDRGHDPEPLGSSTGGADLLLCLVALLAVWRYLGDDGVRHLGVVQNAAKAKNGEHTERGVPDYHDFSAALPHASHGGSQGRRARRLGRLRRRRFSFACCCVGFPEKAWATGLAKPARFSMKLPFAATPAEGASRYFVLVCARVCVCVCATVFVSVGFGIYAGCVLQCMLAHGVDGRLPCTLRRNLCVLSVALLSARHFRLFLWARTVLFVSPGFGWGTCRVGSQAGGFRLRSLMWVRGYRFEPPQLLACSSALLCVALCTVAVGTPSLS